MINWLIKFIGVFLCSVSLTIVVIYFNLVMYGFSFGEYLVMLLKTFEFYFFIPGIFCVIKR